ncbi:hypothetical protein D3C74_398080 [compost metagenome]
MQLFAIGLSGFNHNLIFADRNGRIYREIVIVQILQVIELDRIVEFPAGGPAGQIHRAWAAILHRLAILHRIGPGKRMIMSHQHQVYTKLLKDRSQIFGDELRTASIFRMISRPVEHSDLPLLGAGT